MRDGVMKAERRERALRKRRPVHGRSLQHILRAQANRAARAAGKVGRP